MLTAVAGGVLATLIAGALVWYAKSWTPVLRNLAASMRGEPIDYADHEAKVAQLSLPLAMLFMSGIMFAFGVAIHFGVNYAMRRWHEDALPDLDGYPFDGLWQIEWPWWAIGAAMGGAFLLLMLIMAGLVLYALLAKVARDHNG
jgi:hypothetical protein